MDESQRKIIAEGLEKRRQGSDEKYLTGTERVDIKYLGDLRFQVKKLNFQFPVDEPPDRGGNDTGPNPLAYFLAGAASCLTMQYARLATAKDIHVNGLELTARAHYSRRIRGSFTDIIYDVKIQSKEDHAKIIDLAKGAEEMCFAHQTLLKAGIKMTTTIHLNGQQIATLGTDRQLQKVTADA